MSSRAIRKLQREEEERKKREILEAGIEEESNESEEEESRMTRNVPFNAFNMLDKADDEEDGSHTAEDWDEGGSKLEESEQDEEAPIPSSSTPKKAKKKKGKKKAKGVVTAQDQTQLQSKSVDSQLDEIDLALKSLSATNGPDGVRPVQAAINEANLQLFRLLAVESKHLNALNEMKKLFGSVVTETDEDEAATPRRGGRGPQQLDLGDALAARHSPVSRGQGLKGLVLKRNPFIMGKEEWPQTTSGGLSMELVERLEDGTIEYRFVHSTQYQATQNEFESCVHSMDPRRMITMLQYNPYHVSTLLQVSEIAKQQGDHSVASDLLERTLFTFGRSVHSTFAHALSEGKARLDFRRFENREFWLAAWRYTTNLAQRGTRRTVYEWARLILSLDPEGDPYCISRDLDQLAFRSGQTEHYLQLSQQPFFSDDLWRHLPNVPLGISLAQMRLKQPKECRETLTKAVGAYPWIFARLLQELDISHIPKSVWGKMPRNERETFETEVYVHHAKDLWSTPEAISLLVEVVETAPTNVPPPDPNENPIALDEARHIIISGNPTLLKFVPRHFTSMESKAYDPLPPDDDIKSYTRDADWSSNTNDRVLEAEYADLEREELALATSTEEAGGDAQSFGRLTRFLGPIAGWMQARIERNPPRTAEELNALFDVPVHVEGEAGGEDQENLRSALTRMGQVLRETVQLPPSAATNDTNAPADTHTTGHALRTTVTDEEEEEENDPSRTSSTNPIISEPEPDPDPDPISTDDTLKRYLAGSGLLALKTFCATNGTDPNAWTPGATYDHGHNLLNEYCTKAGQLQNGKTREFILKFALPQGAGKDVADLVGRYL